MGDRDAEANEPGQGRPRRRRRLRRRLLFALYVLVVLGGGTEIGVRLVGYAQPYLYDPIYVPFEADAEIPYVHKPNLSAALGRGGAIVFTDNLGLRCPGPRRTAASKADGEIRIAVLGDSITFGEGVALAEDTFCEVLERALNGASARGSRHVEVLNFAVSAYSVREMAATLRSRVWAVQPDLVLLALIPHDLVLSRTGEVDRWGYTHSPSAGGDLLPKNSRIKKWLRNVHSVYLIRDVIRRIRGGEPGVASAVREGYPYLVQFRDALRRRRCPGAVVLLPIRQDWSDLPERLRRDGIPTIDLRGLLDEFPPAEYRASRWDAHPGGSVHARIGQSLAPAVERLLSRRARSAPDSRVSSQPTTTKGSP